MWHASAVLSDWELWAVAREVMQQHGDRAPGHVAERIGTLALAGDLAGVDVWKAIARRMQVLMSDTAPEKPN